jgi:subtilisin family serine protease
MWVGLAALALLCSVSRPASADREKVLIGFKRAPNEAAVRAVGGRVKYVYGLLPAIAAEIPRSRVPLLRRQPGVLYVEPDYPVYATRPQVTLERDAIQGYEVVLPLFDPGVESLPWGVERVGAPAVWFGSPGGPPPNMGEGIKVGIIDTGIDYTHPDLADNYVLGYDFVNRDWDPLDDNGHGTHVAGIIAAIDDGPNWGGGNTDGVSVVGVAPRVQLYIAKSLDREGAGYMSDIVAALNVAADYDVDIVNMSLGSPFFSRTLRRACDNAYGSGVLLVAAAGNEGMNRLDVPARYSSVIAVGATTAADQRASFSNSASQLELCAPGVGVLSAMPGYTVRLNQSPYGYDQVYDRLSGTSMASPHVSGAAALAWAAHAGWTHTDVRSRLRSTAEDLGPAGKDRYFGYGLVDAAAAAMDPLE